MERHILNSISEAQAFFSDWGKVFAFDTETTTQDIRNFRKQNSHKKVPEEIGIKALNYYYLEMEAMSFCDGKKAAFVSFEVVPIYEFLQIISPIFKNATRIVGHNIAYDIKVLRKHGIKLDGKALYCTMVGDHLLDENRRHGLKALAKQILKVDDTLSYEEARRIGGDTFVEYATNDAIWTWQLMKYQVPLLEKENLIDLMKNIEMPFQHVIVEMESEGFPIDRKLAIETEKVLEQAIEDFSIEMLDYLGERFMMQNTLDGKTKIISPINFESPIQLAKICRDRLGLEKVSETTSGAYSVGKEFLKHHENHDFIKILKKYKIASQLYKLFFKPMPNFLTPELKIHASFNDTGTKTGRLSSSKPNLQQLAKPKDEFPIETRACFIAGTGRKMITCDFSGQEVRVMADISRDTTLVDSLNKGFDMHLAVANTFYNLGIPEECLEDTHPEFKKYKEKYADERQKAKAITFGLCYGKTSFGFAKDFNISEDEAQKLIDQYFENMVGLSAAINASHKEVYDNGFVTYPSGRKRHFEKIQNGDWEGYSKKALRQAFNAKIQGYSGDMMRIALNNVYKKRLDHPEYDIKILGTVHDEGIFTCREEYLEPASKFIKECFESSVTLCVPLISDIGVGDSYSEAK